MALILDTNALSAFADGNEKFRDALPDVEDFAIPAVVLGEYLFGIERSRFRARYEAWLKQFLSRSILLPVGELTAQHYASIRSELKALGRPIPTNDLWIAASALEHGAALLTRDAHFSHIDGLRCGQRLEDFLP